MSIPGDLAAGIHPGPYATPEIAATGFDYFGCLPDSLLLLVFNKIGDVKSLGRCCVVSRRFHSLVPLVENVVVRVDCVISDDDSSSASHSSENSCSPIASLFRVLSNVFKPLQALSHFLGPKRSLTSSSSSSSSFPSCPPTSSYLSVGSGNGGGEWEAEQSGVTHHSPTQVLKDFSEIRFLEIELPSGELGIDDGVLLKWKANFGSTLDNCVILGASSVSHLSKPQQINQMGEDNGSIPDSFYTNGGLKLRVVWTISSLIAASARHYLLQQIIAEHRTLDSLVLTDADGQGVLCMNKDQLEELRAKPLSASSASKRTLVPALNMRLCYAPQLELPGGILLNGATLVAVRPSEQLGMWDFSWVADAFEEPYGTAAKMLFKRRTYCLEMNSF